MRLVTVFLLLSVFFGISSGQNISAEQYQEKLKDEIKVPTGTNTGKSSLANLQNLSTSVDENEYCVDAGDVFLVKIDVPGPAVKVFQAPVTPDGFVVLPDIAAVSVKGEVLKNARQRLISALKKANPNAEVEVYLFQIHPITVTVLGAVNTPGPKQLLSSSRLFDALMQSTQLASPEDTSRLDHDYEMAVRRIKLKRNGVTREYDLFKFNYLGDTSENPYLMHDDIIIVPQRLKLGNSVEVMGAVGEEIKFEFRPGETAGDALRYANGISPLADSAHIELYRFVDNKDRIRKFIYSYQEIKNIPLQPDDRLFVRKKPQYHLRSTVLVEGEVKYPGYYPIEDGKTTLSQLIEKAGGFTERAYLPNAKLLRNKYVLEDKELERLKLMTVEEMTDIEESYFKLRSRENLNIVTVDFEKLFLKGDSTEDVVLRDKDEVIIPEQKKIVFVSGGIIYPGNVAYKEGLNYKDYIRIAGGFNKRAKKGDVKIIKNKTGNWIDAEENVVIEEGDIIFVPEKKERDWWLTFKEGLTIVLQIGTLVIIIVNLKRL